MSVKFTMVMDDEAAGKMTYIGKYFGRSRIKEIDWAVRQYIKAWESEHGEIRREDLEGLK